MAHTFFEINERNTAYFRIMTNSAALIAFAALYLSQPFSENPQVINAALFLGSIAGVRNVCEAAYSLTKINNDTPAATATHPRMARY